MALKTSLRSLLPLRTTRLHYLSSCFLRPPMSTASFHTTRPSLLVLGEKIPPHTLMEKSPTDRIDLQKEIGNKKVLIIGTPAAFSGTCSESHLPGFFSKLSELKEKGIQEIFVISANDPFVMNAWKTSLGNPSVRFLADPQGEWVKSARLDWDATSILGNRRSKRFVAVVEDGAVSAIFVEPDNTGLTVTSVESVLPSL